MMNNFEDFEITNEDLMQIDNIEISLLNSSFQLSSESEDECPLHPPLRKRRRRVLSNSDTSDIEPENSVPSTSGRTVSTSASSSAWSHPKGNQRRIIPYTEFPGLNSRVARDMVDKSPADFYHLLVTDEIFEMTADYTNSFAVKKMTGTDLATKSARIRQWTATSGPEIKRFFGLIIFMGVVKLPKISDYWSKDPVIGQNFPRTIMSRNRFELLLQMLHFSRQDEENRSNRLHRIAKLLEIVNHNFQKYYTPAEEICIDESVVPFRGRIIFRQYNKQKRHKYGIKEFKLCTLPGYTYKINVYAGKNNDEINNTPLNVVMSLCSDLLYKGHTLVTDNWYTSVDLAKKLLDAETHLIGTIRKNRKHLPKDVVNAKLKRGQFVAKENSEGITVMKWKDKRDVLLLSTKHSVRFQNVRKRNKVISKPKIVIDYNSAKGAVDLSDQMAAYSTPLRKSVKWYKKYAINLLLNTAVVNSLILYQSATGKKIQMADFRLALLKTLCSQQNVPVARPTVRQKAHRLQQKEGPARMSRRTCVNCYKINVATYGRKWAKNKTKKVRTYCPQCPEKPFLCLSCFNLLHN